MIRNHSFRNSCSVIYAHYFRNTHLFTKTLLYKTVLHKQCCRSVYNSKVFIYKCTYIGNKSNQSCYKMVSFIKQTCHSLLGLILSIYWCIEDVFVKAGPGRSYRETADWRVQQQDCSSLTCLNLSEHRTGEQQQNKQPSKHPPHGGKVVLRRRHCFGFLSKTHQVKTPRAHLSKQEHNTLSLFLMEGGSGGGTADFEHLTRSTHTFFLFLWDLRMTQLQISELSAPRSASAWHRSMLTQAEWWIWTGNDIFGSAHSASVAWYIILIVADGIWDPFQDLAGILEPDPCTEQKV